ncbi:MAG: radical SAM protein [Planctomycetes bacterium]|nr:radical SAM protein [Planctomycetota bacterium]
MTQQNNVLRIVEVFRSIQGESTFAGLPFAFVRLAGCDVGCDWCDTAYARDPSGGKERTVPQLLEEVDALGMTRVCITGGEPLMQAAMPHLAYCFTQKNYTVLVETSGAYDISLLPWPIIRIMDIKCPSSGASEKMDWYNLGHLRKQDELKIIVGDRADYEWARELIEKHRLNEKCTVLMGAAAGKLHPGELADWLLFDDLDVRMHIQMHKILWPDRDRNA